MTTATSHQWYLSNEGITTWGKSSSDGIAWQSFLTSAEEGVSHTQITCSTYPMVTVLWPRMVHVVDPCSLQSADGQHDTPVWQNDTVQGTRRQTIYNTPAFTPDQNHQYYHRRKEGQQIYSQEVLVRKSLAMDDMYPANNGNPLTHWTSSLSG